MYRSLNKGVVEIKKNHIIIMAVVIVGLLTFNNMRASETQFPIEKTYTTVTNECSDQLKEDFSIEANESEVEIKGQMTEMPDKQHPDYSFFNKKNKYVLDGSIIINGKSFNYNGENTLLFTEVVVNDEEVLLGVPEPLANEEDSVEAYDLKITLEDNLALKNVTIEGSTNSNADDDCVLINK
jgi:hypothetical protein